MGARLIRETPHGIVVPRHLVSPARPLVSVVSSMAFEFTGDRLRLVWFNYTDKLHYAIAHNVAMATRQFMSYARTKNDRAARARRRRRDLGESV